MIRNKLDNNENLKDQLLKLTVIKLRQEAKKLSVPLYSRKSKELLVDLIIKYKNKDLIEDQINNNKELYLDQNFEKNSEVSSNIISDNEKDNSEVSSNIISYEDSKLERLLSKSFPDKEITITDNKDGSQTILII